jgi:hypothetical protein
MTRFGRAIRHRRRAVVLIAARSPSDWRLQQISIAIPPTSTKFQLFYGKKGLG